MQRCYYEQLERIDRLLSIALADDQHSGAGNLQFEDVLFFACQSIWHLKDWVLNDPDFMPKDKEELRNEIHNEQCLRICSDLANGSKHLVLAHPKTAFSLSPRTGIHVDSAKGIFQVHYYVVSRYKSDPFHAIEVRDLLRQCREAWQRIIDRHHLSGVEL